jgi:hypothetical protein
MPRLGDEIRLIRASACQLTQGIEERLCLSQIGRIEAFGEAIVEGLKQRKRVSALVLIAPQPRKAHSASLRLSAISSALR